MANIVGEGSCPSLAYGSTTPTLLPYMRWSLTLRVVSFLFSIRSHPLIIRHA
jgi:hypothetical protein